MNDERSPRYIAVEGLIGVGKTALAQLLAKRLQATLILEEVEENPYIGKFYKDIKNYAFQTQLFFLFSRYKQQQELRQASMFHVVSDYLFEKDRVFAYLNLNEHEITLYEKVYATLVKDLTRPDLVVYLQARMDTIRERIHRRNRGFEADLSTEYLASLSDAYNRFFLHYDSTPLLIVNTDSLDFVKNQDDFENLFREIMTPTEGRRFYSSGHIQEPFERTP